MLATPIPPGVRNRIGEPMSFWQSHDFETIRLGVYVQTVQALAALGSAPRVNCALRRFVVRMLTAPRSRVTCSQLSSRSSRVPSRSSERAAHISDPSTFTARTSRSAAAVACAFSKCAAYQRRVFRGRRVQRRM